MTTGLVKPILQFSEQFPSKYYLTTDPVDGRLYISDNFRRQILRLKRETIKDNFEVVVGNGEFCTEDLINNVTCGDDLLAKDISMSNPKGLAIDRDGTMFFIDGQRIRKLSIENSRVTNLVGSFDFPTQLNCSRFYSLEQVFFQRRKKKFFIFFSLF